jgi:undecaprenyl-diphosphatase
MVFFTTLGDAGLIWIAIVLIFLFQKRYRKSGIYLAIILYLSMMLGDEVLKPIIGRIRPCNEFTQIPLLIARPLSPSFPSGHTIVGFSAATAIYYFHRIPGIAAYFLASLIAFSRMYLFVHYPTDILGGIVIGILSTLFFIYMINKLSELIKKKPDKTS